MIHCQQPTPYVQTSNAPDTQPPSWCHSLKINIQLFFYLAWPMAVGTGKSQFRNINLCYRILPKTMHSAHCTHITHTGTGHPDTHLEINEVIEQYLSGVSKPDDLLPTPMNIRNRTSIVSPADIFRFPQNTHTRCGIQCLCCMKLSTVCVRWTWKHILTNLTIKYPVYYCIPIFVYKLYP